MIEPTPTYTSVLNTKEHCQRATQLGPADVITTACKYARRASLNIKESTIKNAGLGAFATRDIPGATWLPPYLGIYKRMDDLTHGRITKNTPAMSQETFDLSRCVVIESTSKFTVILFGSRTSATTYINTHPDEKNGTLHCIEYQGQPSSFHVPC